MKRINHNGQSLVEYAVVLALIAIIVATVLVGLGQSSRDHLAAANAALDQGVNSSRPGDGGGRPAVKSAPGKN